MSLLIFSALVAVAFLTTVSSAQYYQSRLSGYASRSFTGTFTDATGGSSVNTSSQDDGYAQFSLPFNFNFDNQAFSSGSTIEVSTNGFMRFGSFSNSACCSNWLGYSSSYYNMVCLYSIDMYLNGGPTIYYTVTGSAPRRCLVIEWPNIRRYGGSLTTDMELKLYETTNIIEYLYKDHDKAIGGTAGIGANGGTTGGWQYYTITNTSSTPSNDYQLYPPQPPQPQLSVTTKLLNYGNLSTGQSLSKCVTISNSGQAGSTLTVLGVVVGSNGDYSLDPGYPPVGTNLAVGQTATYCVTFSPIAAGSRSGTLQIQTNGADSGSASINLIGAGIAPSISYIDPGLFRKVRLRLGDSLQQCFQVTSTGTGPLTITSVTTTGLNADQFKVVSMPTQPIAPGSTGTICIQYNAAYEGRPDAQIVVNSNAINTPSFTLQTFATGILQHFAMVLPDSSLATTATLKFDSVAIGQTVCKIQYITNPGSDTLAILRNYLASADYDFTMTPLRSPDTLIAPGQTRAVNVCFTPLKEGIRVATIRFFTNIPRTFPRPGLDTSQFVLSVQGTGVPYGQLAVAGSAVDTGIIGMETCTTDTIRNTGSAALTVTSWSISGPEASEFTVTGATVPFTLQPGQTKIITVCFTATQRGLRSAEIVASGSTSGTPINVTLPLLGYGLQVCASAAPATAFTTTPVLIGQSQTATVTVTNCGDVPTTYSAVVNQPGTDYSVSPAQSTTIAPGSTASFTVTYNASTMGNAAGTLHITGGTAVTPMDVALGAVGGGVTATSTAGNAGDVMVGTCKDVTVSISNTGNVAWTPGTPTFSSTQYTFVSVAPTTIAAGQSGTLTVKFCPTTLGQDATTITFGSASPAPIGGFTATATGRGIANGVAETTEAHGFVLGQNYPNPATAKSDISFTTPGDAMVRIELLDIKGQLLDVLYDARIGAGDHKVTVDTHSLASGTYYYVLTSGTTRLVRQLTVTK